MFLTRRANMKSDMAVILVVLAGVVRYGRIIVFRVCDGWTQGFGGLVSRVKFKVPMYDSGL